VAVYRAWAGSGVTARANSTAYSSGDRMQPPVTDTSTNNGVAKAYVWECTTGGTSGASLPAWSASYTPDSSTITDGSVTWTCRNPGYSSGSTVDWTFAAMYASHAVRRLAAGDILLIHYTSQEASNSTTQNLAPAVGGCKIISVDKDSSEVYTPMGTSGYLINSNSTSINGVNPDVLAVCIEGLTLRTTGTATNNGLGLGNLDDGQVVGRDIRLEITANDSDPYMRLGATTDARSFVSITNLTIARANANQKVSLSSIGEIYGLTLAGAGAVTEIFRTTAVADSTGVRWRISSMDASDTGAVSSSATLVTDLSVVPGEVEFIDPILPSSYAVMTGAGNINHSGLSVTITNGKAGSETGIHQYADALGSATRNTTITYNGESFSWKIDASSSASRACPFVLPWMWGQIATGASVTPKIEILRDGSTTALTDAEVWSERGAQVTSGSPLKTFIRNEAAYTSSGSNIATGAGTGSWAGESGTAWSGKLTHAACTPEGDELIMRICVATTTTLYAAQGWDE